MPRCASIVLLCLLLSRAVVAAEVRQFLPVRIGDGPLLFMVYRDNPDDEVTLLGILDPTHHQAPQLAARFSGHIPTPVARLTRESLLVDLSFMEYAIWELESGSVAPLVADRTTDLITTQGSDVYFVEYLEPHPFFGHLGGKTLGRGPGGRTVVIAYDQPRAHLMVYDARARKTRQVTNTIIEKVLLFQRDVFWVVTADKERQLATITRDGQVTHVLPFDKHWVTPMSHMAITPDGNRLAVSTLHDQQDFHKERGLLVYDIKEKKTLFKAARIPVERRSLMSGSAPHLSVQWLDNRRLEYGEGSLLEDKILDVETDTVVRSIEHEEWGGQFSASSLLTEPVQALKLIGAEEYAPEELFPGLREKVGLFELSEWKLHFPFASAPVADRIDREHQISPDGEWAVAVPATGGQTLLIDGRTRQLRELMPAASLQLFWLPATAKSSDVGPRRSK